MHTYFRLFDLNIPAYGLMIAVGIILANLLAVRAIRRAKMDVNDFIACEGMAGLGAVCGAKGLYLWVAADQIDWSRMTDGNYFNAVMMGGFVFYGGLIGAILFLFLARKLLKISVIRYLNVMAFAIPFAHGFGRIGCFLAGCCYGIPYDGPCAVVFPEGSFALSGVPLFPVQLLEAACLFALSLVLFLYGKRKDAHPFVMYLFLYAVIRFFMEMLRYDTAERGGFLFFSTSQWISLLMIAVIIVWYLYRRKRPSLLK